MLKRFINIFLLAALLMVTLPARAVEETPAPADPQQAEAASHEKEGVDVQEVIFHHLGDGYGWEVPFSHVYRIPLPVIVRAEDGKWFCFSSDKLTEVVVTKDEATDKESMHLVPVIHSVEKDGQTYYFTISHEGSHKNKVVELFPLGEAQAATMQADGKGAELVKHDGTYYREYRPLDISITKNVLALLIASVIVTACVMGLARYYRVRGFRAPRKGMGFFELCVDFVYTGVIKATLGDKAQKFAPYLLTCFFFILTMNLLGLIVIFPGGANLTGNIAITLVLAVLTFIVTNVLGTKHYWKEIFWPDVPIWLKFPLPIMQFIEVFGIFTKPAALCVRLFANMMGGHMIVLTLVCLIFIFVEFGAAALGASTVVSVIFSLFMLALDVLVSFIQAYVFTMLSTMFIAMAQEKGHEHKEHEEEEHQHAEAAVAKN